MGNCICKYNCFYASRIAETFRDSDLRSLVLSIDESRVNLFRSSQHGGRLSWQSQASSSDDFVDQELDEVRKKIDGLIGSDLFAFQGICKTVRLPFWEADSVCECQKHLVKKGGSYFIVSSIVSSKHSATEYMKGSKPTSELWMHIVTWNMNGKMAYDDLSKLVATDKEQYDLYVVGLQEVPNCEVEIVILETLGDDFSLVAAAIMPSLRLYIFARKSLDPYLEDKRVDKVGVGGFGAVVRRQKGAVAVSMKYKDASLLFVTSHLSLQLMRVMWKKGIHSTNALVNRCSLEQHLEFILA